MSSLVASLCIQECFETLRPSSAENDLHPGESAVLKFETKITFKAVLFSSVMPVNHYVDNMAN